MITHHGNLTFTREMEEAILSGKKTKTTRAHPRQEGEIFVVRGHHYRIKRVWPQTLATVKTFYFAAEGFTTPEAFEIFWRHMRRGPFEPDRVVFVHTFEEVDPCEL